MMVLECIYIRKALERIDARNAIEEEGEIPAISTTAEKDTERRQAKTPIERIQESHMS